AGYRSDRRFSTRRTIRSASLCATISTLTRGAITSRRHGLGWNLAQRWMRRGYPTYTYQSSAIETQKIEMASIKNAYLNRIVWKWGTVASCGGLFPNSYEDAPGEVLERLSLEHEPIDAEHLS